MSMLIIEVQGEWKAYLSYTCR